MRRFVSLFALIVTGLSACTDNFETLNTDPLARTEITAAELITEAEYSLVDQLLGSGFEGLGPYGLHYVQHLSQTRRTDVTRYDEAQSSFYSLYTGGLRNLQTVIDGHAAGAEGAVTVSGNQAAVARILQEWAYLSMTDVWGDLPYTEALRGQDAPTPVYDDQQTIYRGVVSSLAAAGEALNDEPIEGDVIYHGDPKRWRRFANSLILRAGLRVSGVNDQLSKEWVKLALKRGVITDSSGTAALVFTGTETTTNSFTLDALYDYNFATSEALVDFLLVRDDPRLPVYAQPTWAGLVFGKEEYAGMPYGITPEEAADIPLDEVSFPGPAFTMETAPAVLLTYSEVLFNRAEAAARGWAEGNPGQLYRQAIKASMQQHGITDEALIANYLAHEKVAYEPGRSTQLIGEQKWISLYFQGVEAWSAWRRLGYPELQPAPAAISVPTIPTRRGYPGEEFAFNNLNYLEALRRQFGGDEDPLDGRVWWDVD
ncbi:SusD/RagB family nutrient-binding outer membrane lipoprotein [Lewinella sp. IMCC34183]|uniref:SusD/RagB family nutrient-binding outer membrane lipoprotein n=1 Tax=Lewinella sp. IMCC34183 TaxID=2248762 RepID=UPI000E28916E|nr:SusD/RagB family nutrient-binding outer membrane lipoprotein [Lewinella sp. IMCC34183]